MNLPLRYKNISEHFSPTPLSSGESHIRIFSKLFQNLIWIIKMSNYSTKNTFLYVTNFTKNLILNIIKNIELISDLMLPYSECLHFLTFMMVKLKFFACKNIIGNFLYAMFT